MNAYEFGKNILQKMDDVTCKMACNHKSSLLDVRYNIQPLKELSRNELAYCGPIVIINSLDTTTC
jgi:hypothetical protein